MQRELARTHIAAQERLRGLAARIVASAWAGLPGYDEADVPRWLAAVVPSMLAAQRQSVRLTEAYLARALERQPVGVDTEALIGAAVRAGSEPEGVYRRPFVTVWTALKAGTAWEQATASGLVRATDIAVTDVQLSSRAAMQAVQDADSRIRGYRRVADGNACSYCRAINGAFVKRASAMPLHPHCGCGLEPILTDVRVTPTPDGVAVHQHGELGPIVGSSEHAFTSL